MKPARPKYDLEFFYTSFPVRDLVDWYKWEFLRRNSEYRADYKKFQDDHGKWLDRKGYWYDLGKRPKWTSRDERLFYAKIAPDIVRLCVKWYIADLHPPQWRFPKVQKGRYELNRSHQPATSVPPELNWDHRLVKEVLERGFTGEGGNARRYGHLLLVEFDLRWPLKDQLDFAKRVLKRAQNSYSDALQERGERFPSGRRRFEDYATHLRVWDLRKKGKSVAQIAQDLFPTNHYGSALQKVQDHLDAAQRLISGHYTEIR
jgi:hypothetical protein